MITAREKKLMILAYAAGVTEERLAQNRDYRTLNSPLGMAIDWACKNGINAGWPVLEKRLN